MAKRKTLTGSAVKGLREQKPSFSALRIKDWCQIDWSIKMSAKCNHFKYISWIAFSTQYESHTPAIMWTVV